ncbi:MAG: HD-GYP domain-containing protein [Acidiferrobacterales bacterium]
MYVSALDRPWRDTPFLFQGFEITDDEQLAQLKQHCKYVYIDTDYQTGTAPQVLTPPLARTPRVGPEETDKKPALRIIAEDGTAHRPRRVYRDKTTIEQEAEVIRETHEQATILIHTIMEDVHLGKSIDAAGAKKAVGRMATSVLRNPDALVCFAQLKKRDDYTALHCLRVSILALAFGRHLGFDEADLNLLGMGALLHDIGKMRVPDTILNKPGKLTDREYEIMKSHVPLGAEILERANAIPVKALEVARLHHERYGGKGYMENLKGDQITEFGLISAIVDVYDAITSDRIYKDGIASLDALKRMYEWRGRDFHPALLQQFIQCIGIFPIGSVVVLNTNEVGVVRTLNREQRLKPQVMLVMKPDKTRYPALRAVDLARETASTGKPYEITKVVPPAMFNIQPVDYLPVRTLA